MKFKSVELGDHLQQEVTSLATLWRLTRKDGQIFRFTDHDQNIQLPSGGTGGSETVWDNFSSPVEIHDDGLTYYLPAPPPDDSLAQTADSDAEFSTGKHFYEVTKNNYIDGTSYDVSVVGIAKPGWTSGVGGLTGINGLFGAALVVYKEDGTPESISVTDETFPATIGIGFDGDANTVTFWVNGVFCATVPTTSGQPYRPWFGGFRSASFNINETEISTNFGSNPFTYPIAGWEDIIWSGSTGPGVPETFLAGTGYTRSAIQNSSDMSADNLNIEGLLSVFEDESLKPEEIRAGLFDQAKVEIMIVNWADPSMGVLKMRRGTTGELLITPDGTFKGELRGLVQQLSQNIGEIYQLECRADLGDSRCALNLTPFTTSAVIATVTNRKNFTVTYTDPQVIALWFNGGRASFTSGANSGRSVEIKGWDLSTSAVTLFLGAPFLPATGDTVNLIPGCDKRKATCQDRFNNYINFRGEPFIPGTDAMLGYPNATG